MEEPISSNTKISINSNQNHSILFMDSNGQAKTFWDSLTITGEELRRYFPDTVNNLSSMNPIYSIDFLFQLGGLVHRDTRRPVRANNDVYFVEDGQSYEVRVPLSKEKKAFNQDHTEKQVEEPVQNDEIKKEYISNTGQFCYDL
jgi:hypothetical protein